MNGAHLHLITNHLPIVGIIIGTLVLIVGLLLKKDQIKQTGLGINVFSAITSIFAFLSGEKAEEVVEEIKGISETLIHTHEEAAELFFTLSLVFGVLSLLVLYLSVKSNKYTKFGYLIVLALSLVLIVVGKQVGTSGGEIRHIEIRSENTVVSDME